MSTKKAKGSKKTNAAPEAPKPDIDTPQVLRRTQLMMSLMKSLHRMSSKIVKPHRMILKSTIELRLRR
jgi:hypothetical protein